MKTKINKIYLPQEGEKIVFKTKNEEVFIGQFGLPYDEDKYKEQFCFTVDRETEYMIEEVKSWFNVCELEHMKFTHTFGKDFKKTFKYTVPEDESLVLMEFDKSRKLPFRYGIGYYDKEYNEFCFKHNSDRLFLHPFYITKWIKIADLLKEFNK